IVYQYQHQYEKAKAVLDEALPIFKKNLGDESTATMNCLGDLEYCYENLHEYDKALPLYQQTLETQRRVLGADSSEVGITLYHIGGIYVDKEDYATALDFSRQSLEVFRKGLGESSQKFKTAQDNVAWLLKQVAYKAQKQGDLAGARKAFSEKLDLDI